jgi:hypothetical protein
VSSHTEGRRFKRRHILCPPNSKYKYLNCSSDNERYIDGLGGSENKLFMLRIFLFTSNKINFNFEQNRWLFPITWA